MYTEEAHRYRDNGTSSSIDTEHEPSHEGGSMSIHTKTCGALGCRNHAHVVINHPRVGRFVACDSHASTHDVLEEVSQ